jgi:hypothetical protein
MAVKSIEIFDYAFERAEHFLKLFDILHNSRQRKAPHPWKEKFARLMRWPVGEEFIRIDGKDKNSMLILRSSLGIGRKYFEEEFTGEILRSSVVASISALDKYMHSIVIEKSWAYLTGTNDIPNDLANLKVPLIATKKALDKLRRNKSARPGSQIKAEVQKMLHREFTFQSVAGINRGTKILGVKDFWKQIADRMPEGPHKAGDIQNQLKKVAQRRNKIVHEADIVRKISAKSITQNSIDRAEAFELVYWVRDFVHAMDGVFNQ